MSALTLNIVTPSGSRNGLQCSSVHLTLADNSEGKGGGSFGIRKGHIKSLLALEKGSLTAYDGENLILKAHCGAGFASVDADTVTVVVEEFEEV